MQKPLRPCRAPGCGVLTREGYCEAHRARAAQAKARKESEAWHWMYGTPLWRKRLRPQQLVREPFCRACARAGRRVKATTVDHIVPHCGDWELFKEPENLQSLCESCHNSKTARETNAGQKSAIVLPGKGQ